MTENFNNPDNHTPEKANPDIQIEQSTSTQEKIGKKS
jgi:hypothetical protein